jgi:hypothetical protein
LLDQLNGCLSQPPPSPDYFEWPCERAVLTPMWAQGRELARSILELFRAARIAVPSLAETTHYRPRGSSGS